MRLKLFYCLLGLSHPVWAKKNAGKRFFYFLNFFAIFYPNFLPRIEYKRNSGLKFFILFLRLSNPVFTKNNTGKRFFNCLNSFAICFGIFLPGSVMNGIRDENFFVSFSAYLIPFRLEIMPERGFSIF